MVSGLPLVVSGLPRVVSGLPRVVSGLPGLPMVVSGLPLPDEYACWCRDVHCHSLLPINHDTLAL